MHLIDEILQFIGLVTAMRYLRKFFIWVVRPRTTVVYYNLKTYTRKDFENRQEITNICHEKLENETNPQKN